MKKIIITLIVISIIAIITLLYYTIKAKKTTYIKEAKRIELATESLNADDNGIIKSYKEYQEFIKENDLTESLTENDFTTNNYLYYVVEIDSCGEEIRGVKDITYKDEIALITLDVDRKCGVCPPIKEMYMIPLSKEKEIKKIDIDYNVVSSKVCDSDIEYKPILYLYPKEETNIKINLEHPERLLTTYPKYKDGWQVKASPNGDLYDKNNNYYYALYWEETTYNNNNFKEGFYVTKEDAIPFLEEKLNLIGLSPKERNEFIMYWLPIIETNEKNIISFELTEKLEKDNKLIITPKPDTLIRVIIHIKKVNEKIEIKEQKLTKTNRIGYTAVEWGGIIHK